MEFKELCWGLMGAKSDWKIVVVRDSSCLGMGFVDFSSPSLDAGVESDCAWRKLFMTSCGRVD